VKVEWLSSRGVQLFLMIAVPGPAVGVVNVAEPQKSAPPTK